MTQTKLWRGLDLAAAVVGHGAVLAVWQPCLGWTAWLPTVFLVAVLWTIGDKLAVVVGEKTARLAVILYTAVAVVSVGLPWFFTWLHAAGLAVLIAFATAWLAWLLAVRQDGLAATTGAALLAAVWLPAADASLVSLTWAAPLLALAFACVLVALFAGRADRLGRRFVGLFVFVGMTLGANAGFLHGIDLDVAHLRDREDDGIIPVYIWDNRPQSLKDTIGAEVHYASPGPKGGMVFGSDNGVSSLEGREIRPLPLGAAADNFVIDPQRSRAYLGLRDGRVIMLHEAQLAIAAQTRLPHGAGVVRLGRDGVWATDRWRHVGLYDRYSLKQLGAWRTRPLSDIVADGKGGFFAASLDGTLSHFQGDDAPRGAPLRRTGLLHALALDAKGRRLFATNFLGTTLQVLDADDLSLKDEIEIGRGGRTALWVDALGVLVVGRYFDGEMVVLGDQPLRVIGALRVGRRLRGIQPYRPTQVLTASAAGVFAIDLARLYPWLAPSAPTELFPTD